MKTGSLAKEAAPSVLCGQMKVARFEPVIILSEATTISGSLFELG